MINIYYCMLIVSIIYTIYNIYNSTQKMSEIQEWILVFHNYNIIVDYKIFYDLSRIIELIIN